MIGIVPRKIKKTSKLYEFSPYIVFGLVTAVVLAYIALLYFGNKTSKISWDLEEKIAQVGTKDVKAIEAQVLLNKQKIDDFSTLFADHQRASNLLKFLEENSHPKIWFNELELSSKDSQAILSGETSNFEILGQQIAIFQSQVFVRIVEISNLSIGKDGKAKFTVLLTLDPKIFQ